MTTSTTTTKQPDTGVNEARAQLETIHVWHQAFQFCDEEGSKTMSADESIECLPSDVQSFLKDEMDWENDPDHDNVKDAIRNVVLEDALEVKVKTDWHALGEEPELGEYMILLCTGGPAVRIVGELEHDAPMSAKLQSQSWFTPWTDYDLSTEDTAALLWYAEQFYWEQA